MDAIKSKYISVKYIDGVLLSPLKNIEVCGGNVLHGMKKSDRGYEGFGEAYFSQINRGVIKGWKRHQTMTLNLIVPVGIIRFVIIDTRHKESLNDFIQVIDLSLQNYQRLTIPPGVWLAFKGLGEGDNMLLNLASIAHDPGESESRDVDFFNYEWSD